MEEWDEERRIDQSTVSDAIPRSLFSDDDKGTGMERQVWIGQEKKASMNQ
jgi:hypothetical protein